MKVGAIFYSFLGGMDVERICYNKFCAKLAQNLMIIKILERGINGNKKQNINRHDTEKQ